MSSLVAKGFHFYNGETKWLLRGVTYGPFRPSVQSNQYLSGKVEQDLANIVALHANTVRVYELPSDGFAELAERHGLRLLIDVPWPKHLDVYHDTAQQMRCIRQVRAAAATVAGWPNVAGLLLGNEIPSDLARWAGPAKVEAFLRRLYEEAKSAAPHILAGYANYPATEYLELPFFDFLGFNVYLHEPADFRYYLQRLKHLYANTPLVLTEVGVDEQRHGEEVQARLLSEDLRIAYDVGMAGAIVFAYTDEWHTGGHDIHQWSFGLVDAERRPKPAYRAVQDVFARAPQTEDIATPPKVSVVIATYNGARTLRQCLESLQRLRYPNYEIIVVDDGSTDATGDILADFPAVRVVRQANLGLSAARNAGIAIADGEIVAFTDADCFADADWLYHLVATMRREGLAGVGGPNLTPEEPGLVAQSIALAPGHATHVLIDQCEAEHVPGCNMAFRRDVLLELGGFDPVFRKAGDDVDIIWRLRDRGYKMGFSSAAFVWHHRRPTIQSYLKQQIGYGEAESLLLRKHPHRFNDRGDSLWRGTIYAQRDTAPLWGRPNVFYGVFCSSGYQCLYERMGGAWPHLMQSPEWWLACLLLGAVGVFAPTAAVLGAAGVALSLGTAFLRARRNWRHAGRTGAARLLIAWFLAAAQPVARGGARFWSRTFARAPNADTRRQLRRLYAQSRLEPSPRRGHSFWAESGVERLDVLRALTAQMTDQGWVFTPNSGWEPWDLSIAVSWWFKLRLISSEENHGAQRRLLRFRYRLAPTSLFWFAGAAAAVAAAVVTLQDDLWGRALIAALLGVGLLAYRQAHQGRRAVQYLVDTVALRLGYAPLGASAPPREPRPAPQPRLEAGDA